MGDRLTLLLIGQVLARPEHLLAAVTSEHEAVSWIANKQPTLLICTAPLEQGSCLSLCQAARQLCPEIQILVLLTPQLGAATGLVSEWKGLDPLVDVAVSTGDLGDSDYPLMQAFIELARQRRYRSPSLGCRRGSADRATAQALSSRGAGLGPAQSGTARSRDCSGHGRDPSHRSQLRT